MDIWIYGYMDIWIYGYMDIWIYGYMDIWIYGYMTWILHYEVLIFQFCHIGCPNPITFNPIEFSPDTSSTTIYSGYPQQLIPDGSN
ncbi:MAG: hypothetical protein EBR40_11680 [Proteobacteria bacterium]|nr:hypothetical protein [Pseudomonadota bacterium]